jgi:hypothetical protein
MATSRILKDAALVASGQVDDVEWHFFASSASASIGADQAILDLLVENNIPYYLHFPDIPCSCS